MDTFTTTLIPKLAAAGCRRPDQAAKNLAGCVADPDATHILPDPFDRNIVPCVAAAIK